MISSNFCSAERGGHAFEDVVGMVEIATEVVVGMLEVVTCGISVGVEVAGGTGVTGTSGVGVVSGVLW